MCRSLFVPFTSMFDQDAFNKLREQIIICHKQPREHRGGLNMINNTNLEFFNSKQKAELFRLKGVFLTSLGAKQEANNAYSHAVQVRSSFPSLLLLLPIFKTVLAACCDPTPISSLSCTGCSSPSDLSSWFKTNIS